MTSLFVESDEEFIEELRNTSENKNTKKVRTTGLKFSNNGQRREEKIELPRNETPLLQKNNSIEGAVARRPEDQS